MKNIKQETFYSVEFKIDGFPYLFQFKIWSISSKKLFILVRESSDIWKRLTVGKIINMKYYCYDLDYPIELETKIEHITKEEHGRFRGHYLVGLKILTGQ
jgi:hypothetical protein